MFKTGGSQAAPTMQILQGRVATRPGNHAPILGKTKNHIYKDHTKIIQRSKTPRYLRNLVIYQ
jgi:hypothetical protein